MRQRSKDMLDTLKRSSKRYTEADFRNLLEDAKSISTEHVITMLFAPSTKPSPGPSSPADPFIKRMDTIKRKSGMKSTHAVAVLKALMSERLPQEKPPTKTVASFPSLLRALRDRLPEAEIESALVKGAAAFREKYSLEYDLS